MELYEQYNSNVDAPPQSKQKQSTPNKKPNKVHKKITPSTTVGPTTIDSRTAPSTIAEITVGPT